jgi:hypothetical protein
VAGNRIRRRVARAAEQLTGEIALYA